MTVLPTFAKGQKLKAADLQALVTAIRANRILPGTGIRVTGSPNGTTISANIPRASQSGGGKPQPFELLVASTGGESPEPRIRIMPSTLAGGSSTNLGFSEGDDPQYLLAPAEGHIVGGITIDSSGEITSRWLEIKSDMPENTSDTFYVEIGTVGHASVGDTASWVVSNSCYGPISVTVCRNWFAADPPFYSVTWFSYGYGGA